MGMGAGAHDLPVHYTLTRGQYVSSSVAITAAAALVASLAWRLVSGGHLAHWWAPIALLAGAAAADFTSGFIHWAADTWGRDDSPVIGPRLLVPFRVHHVNPEDFLRRRFVETNGEVAMIAVPVLLALLAMPLYGSWELVGAFGLAFCGLGMMTNQIHQWAHQPSPPRPVRTLQSWGFLLGRAAHQDHHRRPHDSRYCITTGWLNRPLDACDFFKHVERLITWSTGLQPRHDDRRYASACAEVNPARDSARA